MEKSKSIKYEYCFTKPFLFNKTKLLLADCVGEKLEKVISKQAFQGGGLTLGGKQKDITLLRQLFSALFFNQSLQNKESIFETESFSLIFFTKTTMSDESTILFVWSFDIQKHSFGRIEWEKMEGLEPFQCCELNLGEKVSSNILNVFSDQKRQKILGDLCFLNKPRPIFHVRPKVSSYVLPPFGKTASYIYTIVYNRSIELDEIIRFFSEPVPFAYQGFKTKSYEDNCLNRLSFSEQSKNLDFFFECIFVTMWPYQQNTEGIREDQKIIKPKKHDLLYFSVFS